jgi:hypothetical protein
MPGESEDEQGLPSVSVAIATYDRRPLLSEVLAPLLADRATFPAVRTPGQFATYQYANDYASMCAGYDLDPRRILLNLWGGSVSLRRADLARVPFHSDDDTLRHSDRSLRAGHLYSRSLEGYVADARIQGAGLARLHELHPDLLGELDLVYFETGSRPWTRWVIRARSQLVRPVVAGLLRLLVKVAGQARLFALEARASSLLRLVEQQRGAQELIARRFRSRVGEAP